MDINIFTTLNFWENIIPVEIHQIDDLIGMIITLDDYRVNIWFTINVNGDVGGEIIKELDFAERNFWDIQYWWRKYFSRKVNVTMIEFSPWNIFLPGGENRVYIMESQIGERKMLERTNIKLSSDRVPFEICEDDLFNLTI
jgi:hypothetical protein